jgi:hypothetical protein
MSLLTNELYSLIPLTIISFVYLGRDIFMFNKANFENYKPKFTTTQIRVAIIMYPLWVFLIWVENLSQKRRDYYVVVILNISSTIVGWWTTVAVFNDSFLNNTQQKISLLFSFALSGLWRVFNVLMFEQ